MPTADIVIDHSHLADWTSQWYLYYHPATHVACPPTLVQRNPTVALVADYAHLSTNLHQRSTTSMYDGSHARDYHCRASIINRTSSLRSISEPYGHCMTIGQLTLATRMSMIIWLLLHAINTVQLHDATHRLSIVVHSCAIADVIMATFTLLVNISQGQRCLPMLPTCIRCCRATIACATSHAAKSYYHG